MLFSTSNTGPVLEHMATSLTSLSLLDKHFLIYLTKAQISLGPPRHTTGIESNSLSNSLCRVFSTNGPKA